MSDSGRALVLDANILVRLALGKRIRELVLEHLDVVQFFTLGRVSMARAGTCPMCWAVAASTRWQRWMSWIVSRG